METIISEKEAAIAKERQAIEQLNGILNRLGYRIVPLEQTAAPTGKRRGRPPGSKNKAKASDQTPKRPRPAAEGEVGLIGSSARTAES
jgi:hypothetical protein